MRIVKLADRLSNVQTLDRHPRREKQRSSYSETVEKILPIAEETPWFCDRFRAWRERFSHLDA